MTDANVDPDREVVAKFIDRRISRDPDSALSLLAEGCMMGTPWGYKHSRTEIESFLKDEPNFGVLARSNLNPSIKVKKLCDGTYVRNYRYHRGADVEFNWLNGSFVGTQFREIYFIANGKIKCIMCMKQFNTGGGLRRISFAE